jgi:hypothetical protein
MKLRWFIPLIGLFPLQLKASEVPVTPRVTTVVISPAQVTPLRLRPEFEAAIRMPEEVSSVILGSPGTFKAEHNEAEPNYVYVKPTTKDPAQSNLLIATKSGLHVSLELISDGTAGVYDKRPVDFLIEYRVARSFLVSSVPNLSSGQESGQPRRAEISVSPQGTRTETSSALDNEYQQQIRINAPSWTKWEGKQIETSLGDTRQWNNEVAISYSILNSSNEPVEIVAPQIQIAGAKLKKKRKKDGKGIISDQLEIRQYRLSATRLEPGERADGVVIFDRPNFKQSTEKLFLQIAQADRIDQPILIRLPFTPAINAENR